MVDSSPSVRQPACADNQWYPSRPADLRRQIETYLEQAAPASGASPPAEAEVVALLVPHAGYRFSGPTAAHAYRLLRGQTFERVVLLGPSHYADFGPVATTRDDFFATPLGQIPVDQEFLKELSAKVHLNRFSRDREHSLEVQLPFLQVTLGSFKLAPILMSYPFYIYGLAAREACERLSMALTPLVRGTRTLLVASSDLSHLHDYESVRYFDRRTEMYMEEFNVGGLMDHMANEEHEARACGDAPIITVLETAKGLGANKIHVLQRTNSGEILGYREAGQYTVGYMAVAVTR